MSILKTMNINNTKALTWDHGDKFYTRSYSGLKQKGSTKRAWQNESHR